MSCGGGLVTALLVLAIAVGCGADGEPAALDGAGVATAEEDAEGFRAPAVERPAFGGHAGVRAPIDPAQVSRLLGDPETSEHVRRVVEDGVITFAEYEASVYGFLTCMEGHGFQRRPGDPKLSVRGVYVWLVGRPSPSNPGGLLTEAERQASALEGYSLSRTCEREALGPEGLIDLWWKQAVGPTEHELQAAMEDLATCLEEGGLASLVPESRSYADFVNNRQVFFGGDFGIQAIYMGCATRVQDDWGLIRFVSEQPNFGP